MRISSTAQFILLVICLVCGVAVIMLPGRDERLAVMLDEGKNAQVVAIVEPRLTRGETDPTLFATLGRAHAALGNDRRATELLERYAEMRPNDPDVYARLAELYGKSGDGARQITMLERHVALGPAPAHVLELADLYRRDGRTADERALLGRFETGLTAESGAVSRLAQLRVDAGDAEGAIRVLRSAFGPPALLRPDLHAQERVFLAEVLAGAGHGAEAAALGERWIRQWREAYWAGRLLRVVAVRAPAPANDLADAVAELHPEVRFYLVHELANDGAKTVAHHLLETWPKANPAASMDDIAGFLTACRNENEQDVVWQAFGAALAAPSAETLAPLYAEAIAAEFGIGALAPFWGELQKPVAAHRPLLAARLALHEGNVVVARWLVGTIDPGNLSPPERRMWTDVLTASSSPMEAFDALRARRSHGRLPPDVLAVYARLAGQFGQEAEFRSTLVELSRDVR